MTVGEWVRGAEGRLAAAGVDAPRLEAQLLAAHVLRTDRSAILARPDAGFPELAGESLLQRREAREPLAYLLGWREFYGRRFRVRPGVLIPRQETELLVEAALELGPPGARVLDVGTGSGCLAVTLALQRPDWRVGAVDLSPEALAVAQENAEDLAANVAFRLSDLFAEVPGPYDLIVSNPPYIADGEALMPEVAQYEPPQALYAGPTGLEVYRRLAVEARERLREGGWMLLEVGHTQAALVEAILADEGWAVGPTRRDLQGIPRVVAAQLQ